MTTRKYRLAAAALVLAAVAATPAPASAAQVGVCAGTATWTFSPPLTLANTVGTIDIVGTLACGVYDTNTGLPTFTGGPGSLRLSYAGNCEFAVVTGFTNGYLIGGTEFVGVLGAGNSSGAWTLVPDTVCFERNASGVGAAVNFAP